MPRRREGEEIILNAPKRYKEIMTEGNYTAIAKRETTRMELTKIPAEIDHDLSPAR